MEESMRKKLCDDLTSLQGSIVRDEPREVVNALMNRFIETYESVYGKDIPTTVESVPDRKKTLRSIFADCVGKY